MLTTINFSQRNILASLVLLAGLTVLTLGYSVWQWQSDWRLAHQEIAAPAASGGHDQTGAMIAEIPNEHLFGQGMTRLGEAPVTNLQLRVTGIVKMENDSHASKAYISFASGPSKIYQAGDSLPYGVKVYAITEDAVILENDGRIEKLPLPREQLRFKKNEPMDMTAAATAVESSNNTEERNDA